MGIGDRDYMGDEPRGFFGGGGGGSYGGGASKLNPVWVIIGINLVVFLLWQSARGTFMPENFYVSRLHIEDGRIWTLITAAFSQKELNHFFFNMLVLFFFGGTMVQRWGARRFVVFYLLAAVFTSSAHVLITYLEGSTVFALGASGVTAALLMCFAAYYPKATILFMLIIPMPAWVLVALGVGYDFYGFVNQLQGARATSGVQIGHGIHLAGSLFGAFYVFVWERRLAGGGGRRRRSRARILRPEESSWKQRPTPTQRRDPEDGILDELLEKVSRGGLDSLSLSEREQLERISEKRRSGRR